ncbi:hypothetical protein AWC05_20565 [Mycobacterium florentinum]|uniref:Cytochrome n=1 Tax=Mycobacterium florentinum TaxID=292462 RepID=A0A1X1U8S4_MYCFL|nr:cytochrome P450 [Mycobacterium florentinum]MCV7410620.1 cytochrome P450 [Mycobacterium florentinum]ORV53138.1 hypothetical protein AWC05_20565 [Mycobacterium florentinum]BBX79944.1 biotin biosynthesis cytochrome P450 [Mycobacterium florentinum]
MTASLSDVNILSPDAVSDPYSYFAPLRDTRPVFWDARYKSWLLTSHDVVSRALRDDHFSSNRIVPFIDNKLTGPDADPLILQAFTVLKDWMVFQDEPGHARLRGLVRTAFTPRAIAKMEEGVRKLSEQLLAAIDYGSEFDLIEHFAYPLPAMVIAEMLGVPLKDRGMFRRWAEDIGPLVSGGLDDPDRYQRAAGAMAELVEFFADMLRHYRAQPADNLITALIRARDANDSLTEAEVIATCTLLMFGGHETTANLIANSVLALIRHPDEMDAFCEGLITPADAVEEFLRYDGPGKAVVRLVGEEVEYGGEVLRPGQRVFIVLAAANHDPAVFGDPDALRLRRNAKQHLSFGFGSHFCLGAPLARLEGRIALPLLANALRRFELADRELKWQPVFLTRGLQELWIKPGRGAV